MNRHPFILTAVAAVSAFVGLVTSSAVMAEEWGVMRRASTTINIRAARSTDSPIVGKLQPGQVVKADFREDGWFAIFDADAASRLESQARGYVYAPLLKPAADQSQTGQVSAADPARYRIVGSEDLSYRGSQRMLVRVLMNSQDVPSESEMRSVAREVWNDGNRGYDEFTVFLFLPGMKINSMAYGIGEFGKSGLNYFNVNKRLRP